jgi:hypothetical protein
VIGAIEAEQAVLVHMPAHHQFQRRLPVQAAKTVTS